MSTGTVGSTFVQVTTSIQITSFIENSIVLFLVVFKSFFVGGWGVIAMSPELFNLQMPFL